MILDAEFPPAPTGVDRNDWRAAITAIRGYCGWHIAPSLPETVDLDGWGGGAMLLPSLHVTAVTSVTNDETVVDDFAWSEKGVLRGAYWATGLGVVHVTFTHGYADFPEDILAVARSMVRQTGEPAGRFTSGPHSVDVAPHAQGGPSVLSDAHMQVLERYRVRARL